MPTYFTHDLWSSCNVDPVTEECSSSTVTIPRPNSESCPLDTLLERIAEVSCDPRYSQPIVDALSRAQGCELVRQLMLEQCSINEAGQLCAVELQNLLRLTSSITISGVCDDTSTCSQACSQQLQALRGSSGCCINTNIVNGSLVGILAPREEWLSYDFWLRCGLTTPGVCERSLSGAGFAVPNMNVVTTLLVAALFLVAK